MFPGWPGASRLRRTLPWRSGSGSARSYPMVRYGRSDFGRPTRTGLKSVTSEAPPRAGRELSRRYSIADLGVFSDDEARRYLTGEGDDPRTDLTLAWEVLYRLEPELYE